MSQNIQKTQQLAQRKIIPSVSFLLVTVMVLQLVVSFYAIRHFTLQQTRQELSDLTNRVAQGLTYEDGRWNTSLYTSDPETPHPSGSSGFSTPLYIISADGFVIERNAPIAGFLDSSDFSHLIEFQKAQNISVITNEQWRVLSKPIIVKGKTVGVMVGALYHPERFVPTVADSKLSNTIGYIESKIDISSGEIDVSKVDVRGIDYDISFEIVNNFNKVLLNNGRMPTFIDKSYIYQELENSKQVRTIKDQTKDIQYMVVKQTLYDADNNAVGIVFAGKSVGFINGLFYKSLPYIMGMVFVSVLAIVYILRRLLIETVYQLIQFYENAKKEKTLPSRIEFSKKEGKLIIDTHSIDIPFDSNQYYLCKTIFSNIKKRWEFDEILEEFGENTTAENWRKVYDTMNIINKKASAYLPVRLIELREKTYFLNPDLHALVTHP